MILVFIEGYILAAGDGGPRFVDIGFRPYEVVVFLGRALGDPLINKLTRRIFDRSEVAARNMGLEPCFLFGCQCNWHHSLYHKGGRFGSGIQGSFCCHILHSSAGRFVQPNDSRQSGPVPPTLKPWRAPGRVEEEVG